MTGVCELISMTYSKDEYLNIVREKSYREIIVEESSMYANEWHQAKQDGLSPSFVLRTAKVNYGGETTLRYQGKEYSIYRTYNYGDDIELYCQEVAGV